MACWRSSAFSTCGWARWKIAPWVCISSTSSRTARSIASRAGLIESSADWNWWIAETLKQDKQRRCNSMPMDAMEIERLIRAAFPDAQVTIKDLAGDGDHFAAHVIAREFAGKTRVQQHKMVYDALQGRMGGVLHALALTTAAPKD